MKWNSKTTWKFLAFCILTLTLAGCGSGSYTRSTTLYTCHDGTVMEKAGGCDAHSGVQSVLG